MGQRYVKNKSPTESEGQRKHRLVINGHVDPQRPPRRAQPCTDSMCSGPHLSRLRLHDSRQRTYIHVEAWPRPRVRGRTNHHQHHHPTPSVIFFTPRDLIAIVASRTDALNLEHHHRIKQDISHPQEPPNRVGPMNPSRRVSGGEEGAPRYCPRSPPSRGQSPREDRVREGGPDPYFEKSSDKECNGKGCSGVGLC